jgi:hypothetical protein
VMFGKDLRGKAHGSALKQCDRPILAAATATGLNYP